MMVGSLNLSTAYQQYINTISKASAKLSQCTVSSSNIEIKFRARLTSVGTKLNTTLILASNREVHNVDSLILKVGEIFSKYMTILQGLYLESSRTITQNVKGFVNLFGIQKQDEFPSVLGVKLAGFYYDGIKETNIRTEGLYLSLFKAKLERRTYQSFIGRNGKTSQAIEDVSMKTNALAKEIFNQNAEYFVPPAFTPTTLQIYTDSDLKLANVLSTKENLCLKWQVIVNSSFYSCGYFESGISSDELERLIQGKKDKQNEVVKTTYDDAVEQGMKLKESMASNECLKGLLGLSVENTLVDITDFKYFKLLSSMRDYLMKTGCTAMTGFFNSQIKLIQEKLDSVGNKLDKETYGLVGIKTKTNSEGVFGVSGSIVPIFESDVGKKFSDNLNASMNKLFFNKEKPYGNSNYVEIMDDKYSSVYAPPGKKESIEIKKQSLEEKVDEAYCNIVGC